MKVIGRYSDQVYDSYRNVVDACEMACLPIPSEAVEYFAKRLDLDKKDVETDTIPSTCEDVISEFDNKVILSKRLMEKYNEIIITEDVLPRKKV